MNEAAAAGERLSPECGGSLVRGFVGAVCYLLSAEVFLRQPRLEWPWDSGPRPAHNGTEIIVSETEYSVLRSEISARSSMARHAAPQFEESESKKSRIF